MEARRGSPCPGKRVRRRRLPKGTWGSSAGVSEPPQAASSPAAQVDEEGPGSPAIGRTADQRVWAG
jgi:hypothetical protein